MNNVLNFENLNYPIEKMLESYCETSNPLTEEEKQQIKDELVEYVPVGSDSDEDVIESCGEEEDFEIENDEQNCQDSKNRQVSSSIIMSAGQLQSENELNLEEQEDSISKSNPKKVSKRIAKISKSSPSISSSSLRKMQVVNITKNTYSSMDYDSNSLSQRSKTFEQMEIRRKKPSKNLNLRLRLPYEVPCPYESFFLMGEVVIEMNFSAINNETFQNCILNLYKPVQRVVYNKNTRCLSMFQASNSEFLIDFGFLSKQLMNYPDKNVHLVGRLIEKYQDIAKLIHLQIKNARSMSGFDPELIAQRRAYFDEQVTAFLKKVDEHQMYFIQKYNTNYDNANFEVSEVGYSRQLLALLGTDENTITSIILRQGKPELYNFESRLKMMLVRMLSIVQGKFKGSQSNFEIYTLDEIRVFAKLTIVPVCIEYPPHLQINLENYKEINVLAFGLIEVAPTMIQQIITIRSQDKCNRHLKSIVQEYNYTEQSEYFLEKYYEISKQNYHAERQNLQKRKKIFDDNEKILIGIQNKHPQDDNEDDDDSKDSKHINTNQQDESSSQQSSLRESQQDSLIVEASMNQQHTGALTKQEISSMPIEKENNQTDNNNSNLHGFVPQEEESQRYPTNHMFKRNPEFPQASEMYPYQENNNCDYFPSSTLEIAPPQPGFYDIPQTHGTEMHTLNNEYGYYPDEHLSNPMQEYNNCNNRIPHRNLSKVHFPECATLDNMVNGDTSLNFYGARNIYDNEPAVQHQNNDIEEDLIKLNHFTYIDSKVITQNVSIFKEPDGICVKTRESPQSKQRTLQIVEFEEQDQHKYDGFNDLRFEFDINSV